jgi:hypothetical protein
MQYYRALWAELRKAKGLAEAERKPLHAALGLPASSKEFSPADMDAWKRHVLAETRPEDMSAQLAQMRMAATRKRVFIGHLLAALGLPEEYADAIVRTMNSRGRFGGAGVTLRTLPPDGLDVLRNRLKDLCRERWATKEHLLGEVRRLMARAEITEAQARESIALAMAEERVREFAAMTYEELLIVLSVVRALADGGAIEEDSGDAVPF